MKKMILTLTAILLWLQTNAQENAQVNAESQFTYCEIVGTPRNNTTGKSVIRIVFSESNQVYLDNRKNQATVLMSSVLPWSMH